MERTVPPSARAGIWVGAVPASRLWARARAGLLVTPLVLLLGILILWPMVVLFLTSLQTGRYSGDATWTPENYLLALRTPKLARAFVNTLLVSAGSVLMTCLIGVPLAWLVARTDMPGKRLLHTLNVIPFFLSSVVGAVSWQTLAATRSGLLNHMAAKWLGASSPWVNIFGVGGIIWVIGLFYTPYVYLMLLAALQNMDPALEEAARLSGSTALGANLRITVPLVLPSLLSAMILVFVTSAGLYGVPLLLGSPARVQTLSTEIYAVTQDYPPHYELAAAISVWLFLLTLTLIIVERKLIRSRSFVTVTGRGYRPRTIRLGKWAWAALAFNGLYLLVAVGLPFLSLLLVSVQKLWTGWPALGRFTFQHYAYVFLTEATAIRGMKNSLLISTLGASVAVPLCVLLAYVTVRWRLPGRELVDFIAFLPVTIPGIVLGMGFLAAWVSTPLYGTVWIIMMAYIGHYLAFGLRNIASVLRGLSSELEESSRVSGAGWGTTFRRISGPLLAPGLIATWLLLFVTFVREVSASIMLYTPGTETLSVALIRLMQYAPFGGAAAFSVIQTLLLLAVIFIFNRVAGAGALRL